MFSSEWKLQVSMGMEDAEDIKAYNLVCGNCQEIV